MSSILIMRQDNHSRISENLPKRGGFRTFKITVSTNLQRGVAERFLILSSGRLGTIVRTLFGKWLWDELTKEELEFFLTLPGVMTEPTIIACLRARSQGIPKSLLRKRLGLIPFLVSFPSRSQYVSLKGQLFLSVLRQEVILSKTQKYSGYSRHHNDKGSMNPFSLEDNFSLPEEFVPSLKSKEELILDFLTTGESYFFAGGSLYNPEK